MSQLYPWQASQGTQTDPWETYGRATEMLPKVVKAARQTYCGLKRSFTEATKSCEATSGNVGTTVEMNNVGVVPAMFLPGRGAEQDLVSTYFGKPINFKYPLGAEPTPKSASKHAFDLFRGVRAQHNFMYKIVQSTTPTQANPTPATRTYVHNVFRHGGYQTNTSTFASNTTNWNRTLGPDGSYIRRLPAAGGSAYAAVSGLVDNLLSPCRNPNPGNTMLSRLTMQCLENISWNCNPLKWKNFGYNLTGATAANPTYTQLLVYDNAYIDAADDSQSLPAKQPRPNNATSTDYDTTNCIYRCQFKRGRITYQFSNDNAVPIVVDLVIHKLKDGETLDSTLSSDLQISSLTDAYQTGFTNLMYANKGAVNLGGNTMSGAACLNDAKVEFMPAKALKAYRAVDTGNGGAQPWRQLGRDQFIIAPGQVKAWGMDLPAMNFSASNYDTINNFLDDRSVVVSVAVSSVATPVVEVGTGGVLAQIDRKGSSLTVSVTGTYSENPLPVYMSNFHNSYYINGRLYVPQFVGVQPTVQNRTTLGVEEATRSQAVDTASVITGTPYSIQQGA